MTPSQAASLALLFPGQGSQFVGMGGRLLTDSANARNLLQEADEVLGLSLTKIISEGPENTLNDTAITQPAILAITIGLWKEVEARLGDMPPILCCAGHSLGEFSALTIAGALSFEDAIRLVRQRGQAMSKAGLSAPGGMGVILGLEDDSVQELVQEIYDQDGGIWIANWNCPGQVVISGRQKPLEAALSLAKQKGAKRAMPLAVSVASHTPLMQEASQALAETLADVALKKPRMPVICNVWARPLQSPDEIRQALLKQLTHPVQWTQSVIEMQNMGVSTTLEIGPKAVLTGLVRRIQPSLRRFAVTDMQSAHALQREELLP